MNQQVSLRPTVGLILIVLFSVACAGPIPTPAVPTPEPEATATPVPPSPTTLPSTPSPTMVPATPIPPTPYTPTTAASGVVQGKLIAAESEEPLPGGAIILCLVSGKTQCDLQASLTALAGENGSFELSDVPPGQYVVLYEPSGEFKATWEETDELTIDYGLTSDGTGIAGPFEEEFIFSFGGGGLEFHDLSTAWEDGEPKSIEGAVSSAKYGLALDFREGEPIKVDVQSGETTQIEIASRVAREGETAQPTPTVPPTSSVPTYSEVVETYPEGTRLCETELSVVEVSDDGSWSLRGSVEVFEGEDQFVCHGVKYTLEVPVTIEGKTYPAGTKLTVDENLEWVEVSSWDGGVLESTSTPPVTLVPPTLTPASTPTVLPSSSLTLAEALAQGLVRAEVRGEGASSGASITISVTRLEPRELEIELPAGTVFRSENAGAQDMIARQLLGVPAGGGRYRPVNKMVLSDDSPHEYIVEAYCLNFHRDNPGTDDTFEVEASSEPAVTQILAGLNNVPEHEDNIGAIQAAIWAVTDDVPRGELMDRFSVSNADIDAAEAILRAAGLDPSAYELFQ